MGPDNKTLNIRHLTTRLKSYGTWQQSNHKQITMVDEIWHLTTEFKSYGT